MIVQCNIINHSTMPLKDEEINMSLFELRSKLAAFKQFSRSLEVVVNPTFSSHAFTYTH